MKYEIRHGKKLYVIPREDFVSLLVEVGVPEANICLDGHPKSGRVQP